MLSLVSVPVWILVAAVLGGELMGVLSVLFAAWVMTKLGEVRRTKSEKPVVDIPVKVAPKVEPPKPVSAPVKPTPATTVTKFPSVAQAQPLRKVVDPPITVEPEVSEVPEAEVGVARATKVGTKPKHVLGRRFIYSVDGYNGTCDTLMEVLVTAFPEEAKKYSGKKRPDLAGLPEVIREQIHRESLE